MPGKMTGGSWTEEATERLRTLWGDKLPASEIGRRLGLSKNAVLGKAWRLALPRRRPPDTPTPAAKLTPPGAHQCRWPLGDPGTAGFRFCNEPAAEGRPYCEAHCRCAYARHAERDRR
ncbi:MAG TPA: GcrA family cell cycle regulator [Stellaceae bacterium]|nr:GcrA family cell cycle regulator [Stellaceae bacterium]